VFSIIKTDLNFIKQYKPSANYLVSMTLYPEELFQNSVRFDVLITMKTIMFCLAEMRCGLSSVEQYCHLYRHTYIVEEISITNYRRLTERKLDV
jgi:hypothetical protein